MRFSFTDEQMQFREIVERFVNEQSPSSEVRRLMATETGYDADVWRRLCTSIGLQAIHIPEEFGGQGFGAIELCIAMEELGRGLFCSPLFGSSVLAGTAILEAGRTEDRERWLPALSSGDSLYALAIDEGGGYWDAEGVIMQYERRDGNYRLKGKKTFVVDGCSADAIVTVARQPRSTGADGIAFFVVEGNAPGLSRRLLNTIDQTRKLAELEFDDVIAEPLGEPGAGGAALDRTIDLCRVCLANEMVGGAQRLLDSAVEYAGIRVQFGRAIGSFQAIKHKCADLLLRVELAKSAAYVAAEAADANDVELPALAALSKALAAETYLKTATQTIQIHGGIGFTWENDTHLYFKRAKSSESMFGQSVWHRERMLQRWQI
ncbi:MAG: acyl-CoA dehydrogenase family protein [Pseudomonadales bacterium]